MLVSFLFCGLWLYNRDRQLQNLRPCSIIKHVLRCAIAELVMQTSLSVQLQEVVKCLSVDYFKVCHMRHAYNTLRGQKPPANRYFGGQGTATSAILKRHGGNSTARCVL
jgi:hypothetical protein